MTRDELREKLEGLVQLAYRERMSIMDVWSALSEQLKLVEMIMEVEFCQRYRNIEKEKHDE